MFLGIFFFQIISSILAIHCFIEITNLREETKREYQHVLNNLKNIKNFQNEI